MIGIGRPPEGSAAGLHAIQWELSAPGESFMKYLTLAILLSVAVTGAPGERPEAKVTVPLKKGDSPLFSQPPGVQPDALKALSAPPKTHQVQLNGHQITLSVGYAI